MKLAYKNFSTILEMSSQTVAAIVIENPKLLYKFLVDIRRTKEEQGDEVILSDDNRILDFSKCVELLTDFIQFDLNQKTLLSKITASLDKISVGSSFYHHSQQILAQIENHIMEMAAEFPCEIVCEKLNMQNVMKAAGIAILDDYVNLPEKILAYMELARDFLNKRLFILVNARGFISCQDMQMLIDAALSREHEILLIDSVEYPKLKQERRLVIDEDFCEI